jgi:hypothetical protein
MTIEPPDRQPISATVKVIWRGETPDPAMGVRFVEISDDDLQFISKAVSDYKERAIS